MYGVNNYLDISTLHISEKTLRDSEYKLAVYDTGAIFWVPDTGDFIPDELKIIFEYARNNNCSLIRFDADGFEFPEFPQYDWE